MSKLYGAGCCLIILTWSAARGTEPARIGFVERCRPVERTILNATLTTTTCTVEVPVKKGYTVQTKDVPSEVPCTKMVPVCVQDPCTGQTRTELQPQTVLQKATTTYILVLPPEGPDTTRKEEQKKMSVHVVIGHAPGQVVEQVPVAYPGKKKCR
jgi:hypothetical protein